MTTFKTSNPAGTRHPRFTTYKKFIHPTGELSIEELYLIIRSDKFKAPVTKIRELLATGHPDEADVLKKNLPGFTVSCRCEGGRSQQKVTGVTGYIILDFDNLSQAELFRLKFLLTACPHVLIYFISVSGNGLKVIVETTNAQTGHHRRTFDEVRRYFERLLDIKIDPSGSDITRLCFFSHDTDAYYNQEHRLFDYSSHDAASSYPNEPIESIPSNDPTNPFLYPFQHALTKTEVLTRTTFDKCSSLAHIKNFLFTLAAFCNAATIPYDTAFKLICQNINEDMGIIMNAVGEAYSRHGIEKFYSINNPLIPPKPGSNQKPGDKSTRWSDEEIFQSCVALTSRIRQFVNGGRNNFVFLLACNCYRAGLSEQVTLQMILDQFNYNETEIFTTVRSAFRNCWQAA